MDRLTLALTVAFAVIGVVMVGVWALAHFGARAMLSAPSARTQRRLGYAMIAGGLFHLVILLPVAVLSGDIGRLLFSLVQGGFFLAWGIETVRQHREGRRGDTTDGPLARTVEGEEAPTGTPPIRLWVVSFGWAPLSGTGDSRRAVSATPSSSGFSSWRSCSRSEC